MSDLELGMAIARFQAAELEPDITGRILVSYAQTINRYTPSLDVSNTEDPEWEANFGATYDIGLFKTHVNPTGQADTGTWSGQFDFFELDWRIGLISRNACWTNDLCDYDCEFIDADGNVIAALQTRPDGSYRHGLWYGPHLGSLTKAGQSGSYPRTTGELTFESDRLIFTHDPAQTHQNKSFTLTCDMASVRALRFPYLRARETYTGGDGCSAGVHMSVLLDEAE